MDSKVDIDAKKEEFGNSSKLQEDINSIELVMI
jgi:hypothetical protein